MNAKSNFQIRKFFLYATWLTAMLLILWFGTSNSSVVRAQGPVTQVPNSQYFTSTPRTLDDGTILDETIINGPSTPPPGYELERSPVALPRSNQPMGTKSITVPAYNWVYGCSSVSASMIAGYYDRNGYPNIYTGPANGGVVPLDNSVWGTWWDGYSTYPNLPLAASHQGVDGRATRGSIDDYWVQYNSATQDPYITNGWSQHTWGDAIGDYMKTSQSSIGNTDGSTMFWNYNSSSRLTCSLMETLTDSSSGKHISALDGTYGRKLYYQAKGYNVTDCYNQKTDNLISGGFSFAQYKAEIDAGRPVMLNLAGHTIVGVGYDNPTNTVYLHDTWDYLTHTMTWGGSYSGMALQSVSIVNLSGAIAPATTNVYLPLISMSNGSTPGIYGRVLNNGTAIGGISLSLRFYNGSTWSSYSTTTTAADGTYGFTGLPSLTSGQYYYVKFQNTAVASGGNSNYLWYRGSPYLSSYAAGNRITNADMDIANIPMTAPPNGSTVSLPYMFQWTPRTSAPSDSYELDLYDASGTPYWYTNPSLGYAASYTLNSRPSGFTTGVGYNWDMWVYAPDGGDGESYYYRTVTFASGSAAPQDAAPRMPKKANPDLVPRNEPAP